MHWWQGVVIIVGAVAGAIIGGLLGGRLGKFMDQHNWKNAEDVLGVLGMIIGLGLGGVLVGTLFGL